MPEPPVLVIPHMSRVVDQPNRVQWWMNGRSDGPCCVSFEPAFGTCSVTWAEKAYNYFPIGKYTLLDHSGRFYYALGTDAD